ncbi:SDR family oxidoreductase [Flavobacteriaceae bacterium]|nr:SDR family oxidoreductase [Flavobacteriaceae bacterium]
MEKVGLKKALILGSSGMLGHVLFNILRKSKNFELFDISYRNKLNSNTIICDVTKTKELEKIIHGIKPNIIINCVGVLLNRSEINPANTIFINSYLPHFLKSICKGINCKIIQISTDCIFSGSKGQYDENDIPDAIDLYGKSKMLGEIINKNDLTIRTSIIGPELKKEGAGLFDWFKRQRGDINGFSNVYWGGVTTIVLAKKILNCIIENKTGLYHLTNGNKISKYSLLCLISEFFPNKNLKINKTEVKWSDKSLKSIKKNFNHDVPSYREMIEEMKKFIELNKNDYHFN